MQQRQSGPYSPDRSMKGIQLLLDQQHPPPTHTLKMDQQTSPRLLGDFSFPSPANDTAAIMQHVHASEAKMPSSTQNLDLKTLKSSAYSAFPRTTKASNHPAISPAKTPRSLAWPPMSLPSTAHTRIYCRSSHLAPVSAPTTTWAPVSSSLPNTKPSARLTSRRIRSRSRTCTRMVWRVASSAMRGGVSMPNHVRCSIMSRRKGRIGRDRRILGSRVRGRLPLLVAGIECE